MIKVSSYNIIYDFNLIPSPLLLWNSGLQHYFQSYNLIFVILCLFLRTLYEVNLVKQHFISTEYWKKESIFLIKNWPCYHSTVLLYSRPILFYYGIIKSISKMVRLIYLILKLITLYIAKRSPWKNKLYLKNFIH